MNRTLTIEGRNVPVDESFFRLAPEQQADIVSRIAQSLRNGDAGATSFDQGRISSVTVRPAGDAMPAPVVREPIADAGGNIGEGHFGFAQPTRRPGRSL